jgi:hypothetical protein
MKETGYFFEHTMRHGAEGLKFGDGEKLPMFAYALGREVLGLDGKIKPRGDGGFEMYDKNGEWLAAASPMGYIEFDVAEKSHIAELEDVLVYDRDGSMVAEADRACDCYLDMFKQTLAMVVAIEDHNSNENWKHIENRLRLHLEEEIHESMIESRNFLPGDGFYCG